MRLFVAVEVPADVRAEVDAAVAVLRRRAPHLRWVEPSRWHLTLVFLGRVHDGTLPAVDEAGRSVCTASGPLPVALSGELGTFRRAVVWAGLEPSEPLARLGQRLGAALGNLVALPDTQRSFHAHLTLARAGKGDRVPRDLLEGATVPPLRWQVEQVVLFSSVLSRGGARYEPQAVWPLRG